jgi:acyl-CoA thioester hydrolase
MNDETGLLTHDNLDLRVKPEWIDFNGHMNIACYVTAFDLATDNLFWLVTPQIWKDGHFTDGFFIVEMHVTYERELYEADPLRFDTLMLGVDDKRLHYLHRMYHAEQGYLAATNEIMFLSVDMATRKVAPMRDDIRAPFEKLADRHACRARPPQVGRVMSVGARKPGR